VSVPDTGIPVEKEHRLAAELRRFLELGAAQLDAAVRESDQRVQQLASAIGEVIANARELQVALIALQSDQAEAARRARERIAGLAEGLIGHAHAAITAMQFYDKLIQRLTHVREGLAIPSDSTANTAELARADWDALLEKVRDRYSTVEERVLFDFMMRGLSAEQMLKALTGLRASAASGEFEAF
jgi:hypothetical protein